MIAEDEAAYRLVFRSWATEISPGTICLLSPCGEQTRFMKETFPNSSVTSLFKDDWDLNQTAPKTFDLVAAMNVFMYSDNPRLWFRNTLAACKLMWLQDLIVRKRDKSSEFGQDGDKARFRYLAEGFEGAFDLSGVPVERFCSYDAGIPNGVRSVHFLAQIKGSLT